MERRKRGAGDMSSSQKLPVVEKILKKRRHQERIEYLVKWKGEDITNSTWEPEENLSCGELVAEFERERRNKQKVTVDPMDEDRKIDRIVGMCEEDGERYYLIKFTNNVAQLMPAKQANSLYIDAVLRFFEENVKFDP